MNTLEKRNFGLYAVGRFVSMIGSGIQMIAIPLYILDLTGSGAMMGIFTFLNWLPTLAMAPFAGVLGDRWNRKKIMVNTDFARGSLILILALLAVTNNMNIYILFVCQVIISLLDSIFVSSTAAMIPELVKEDDLMRANSLMASLSSISWIVGPILGGVVYGFGGIKMVFLINGVSFVLSAISELFIKYVSKTQSKEKLALENVKRDFKEGFSFIKGNRNLLTLLIFFCSINFLMNPAFAVVIPFVMKKVIGFSPETYGVIQSTFMVGLLAGNILIASILAKKSSKLLIKLGLFGTTSITVFLALSFFPESVSYFGGPTLKLVTVLGSLLAVMGIFNALLNTPIQTNMQKLIPNKLRSRVSSVSMVITQAGVPLGAVVYGVLLDLIPAHYLFITISVLTVALSIGFLLVAPSGVYDPKNEDAKKSIVTDKAQPNAINL